MRTCVFTAVAGGYERELRRFPEVEGVDRVAFVDGLYGGPANGWQLRPMVFQHAVPRMRAKFYKVFPHLFLGEYDRSVWVDASVEARDGAGLVGAMLDHTWPLIMSAFRHPTRDCVYDEAVASLDMPKYAGEPVLDQVAAYRKAGHPRHWGLWAGTVLGRDHRDPRSEHLANAWWTQIRWFSYQDQLSLAFVLRQSHVTPVDVAGDLYDNELFTAHFQPEAL